MARIAINGFGRIGRAFCRLAYDNPAIEIVAINDLGNIDNLAYLLKYDTVYGRSPFPVENTEKEIVINGKPVAFLSERDPTKLPWGSMNIDVVIEATGVFTSYEKSKMHLEAGAKRVVISGPAKDDPAASNVSGATVLMGVNDDSLKTCTITSNASCTTNATSPVVAILKETIGIEKALLNTVHAYTSTQALVDGPAKDFRKGRAAAQNIIPTTTGAAVATTLAHTDLSGMFDGIAMRVPVPVGSIVDITFVAKRPTSVEEVNSILTEATKNERWSNLLAVTNEQIVSSDIIGARFATIVDLAFTRVVGGNLVKVLAWYDNESSYTHTLVQHVQKSAGYISSS